jgi:translation initiation factor eIF-2B subunit alpha/methylthioribose-1-phosphate isomerase
LKIKNVPQKLVSDNKFTAVGDDVYDIRAIWFKDNLIKLIDQRVLPNKFDLYIAKNHDDVAYAISEMVIRGAPAIGAMAVYGMAQAANQEQDIEKVSKIIKSTRPTAFDLFFAVDYMNNELTQGTDPTQAANKYVEGILARCKKIGEFGVELIKTKNKILTHCNAGALATVDFGTALAPIRLAHSEGKEIFVFVDETRPRLQGAKLTAWELYNEGIPHTLIVDNAAGYYFSQNEIDIVITGADRIARSGDAANKIGTYEKAVLAHENDVPFYIAAPISTFDPGLDSGKDIPIEQRNPDEVLLFNDSPITNDGITASNPAFDVTPHKYITGFITEFGIIKPGEIEELLSKHGKM